jgi:hypothetical protein
MVEKAKLQQAIRQKQLLELDAAQGAQVERLE